MFCVCWCLHPVVVEPCLFTVDTGECYLTFQEKNLQNSILNKQVEGQHMETCQDNSHKHFTQPYYVYYLRFQLPFVICLWYKPVSNICVEMKKMNTIQCLSEGRDHQTTWILMSDANDRVKARDAITSQYRNTDKRTFIQKVNHILDYVYKIQAST